MIEYWMAFLKVIANTIDIFKRLEDKKSFACSYFLRKNPKSVSFQYLVIEMITKENFKF